VVATQRAEQRESRLRVTLPHQADDAVVRAALAAHKPGESDA